MGSTTLEMAVIALLYARSKMTAPIKKNKEHIVSAI